MLVPSFPRHGAVWCRGLGFLIRRNISTVEKGRAFEELTIASLTKLNFTLERCGGRGDGGIDFEGTFAGHAAVIKVLGQCKCLAKPVHPAVVRELIGVVSAHEQTLGIVASSRGYTKASVSAMLGSATPTALITVDPVSGDIVHAQLNKAAGLLVSVSVFSSTGQRAPLMWMGTALGSDAVPAPARVSC
eukprot:Colp12_sorted_trinity150504_noHs@8175